MVQPSIDNEEGLPARNLAVDDAGDVDSSFAYQVAAEFDDQMGARHFLCRPLRQMLEILANRGQIEPVFSGEVGDAEAATKIEEAHRRRGVSRQPERQFVRFLLGLADRFGTQILRTGKKMKALESQSCMPDLGQ